MLRFAKTLLTPVLVSACAFMLSACSGGSKPNPSTITAQANFPSSVNSNVAFSVTVSLTSSNGSGGTASVQLVDVGTATPTINCGSAQSVTIGGPSMTFSCQAPQVSLGGSNAHQLQIDVNGVANLSAPASVNVVNGGTVDVQLTGTSGAPITTATPGESINVAFSTTGTPAGAGQYTATAPSGWTVGNSGVCNIGRQSTSCTVPVTIPSNAASGSYNVTIASESGSSPLSATSLPLSVQATPPPTSVITAHANIPSSVNGGATFTVGVSLTSSNGPGGTASVQLVDVGTATPAINCGASQSVAIGGASTSFSCQAPPVNLGGNNTHQMQVDVNGVANLSSPVSVDVVNGGEVTVQLVQVLSGGSDVPVTQLTPGETVDVLFMTTTNPAGVGEYTVTVPSGWTLGNGGVCSINQQTSMCMVPITVAANAANGPYSVTIAAQSGSSPLSATSLPITVQATPPTSEMAFDLAQNLSDTLYANIQGHGPTFTYQPIFFFKNTSGNSLLIDTVNVSGLTNVQYGCNITAPDTNATYTFSSTPDCTLTPTGLYAVTGTLPDNYKNAPSSDTLPVGSASMSIGIAGGGTTYTQYTTSVVFVEYVPNHVAFRVANNDGNIVYAAAVLGPDMITFDANNQGTASTFPSNKNFDTHQIRLSASGGILYLPYGDSGDVYLTRATGGFNTTSVPDPAASPAPPAFLNIEYSYYENNPGGSQFCPSPSSCEYMTVDQTYVNSISMLGSFNAMGNTGPLSLDTQDITHGTVTDLTQTQIYQNMETSFDNQGLPWKYVQANGQKNYFQKDANGNTTAVLAPVEVNGSSLDPMQSGYYDTYVNSLWTYLETHPIYIFIDGTGNPDYKTTTAANCVLKGQVDTNSADKTYNELVFSASSGTCPAEAYAIASPFNGAYCGYTGAVPANQACADTPNLVVAKPNECDFSGAAGANDCHDVVDPTKGGSPQAIDPATFFDNVSLWGPNGTYRAEVGRAIASYQAIGLLPNCANPSEVMVAANARTDIANGEGFTNPSCLTGLGSAPTWNVYVDALKPYVDVYDYSYGDFLGLDGTISFAVNSFLQPMVTALPTAQPITVILH